MPMVVRQVSINQQGVNMFKIIRSNTRNNGTLNDSYPIINRDTLALAVKRGRSFLCNKKGYPSTKYKVLGEDGKVVALECTTKGVVTESFGVDDDEQD